MSTVTCSCGARIKVDPERHRSRRILCPRCGSSLEVLEAAPEAASEVRSCPYCRTGIFAGARVVTCTECQQPYHATCWEENGGCAVYGCPAAPQHEKGEHGDEWTQLIACAACGEMIKVGARRCPRCREDLEHLRQQPSRAERLEREARSRELRTGFILLGISIVPCVAPVMLFVNGFMVLGHWQKGGQDPRAATLMVTALAVSLAFCVLFLLAAL